MCHKYEKGYMVKILFITIVWETLAMFVPNGNIWGNVTVMTSCMMSQVCK